MCDDKCKVHFGMLTSDVRTSKQIEVDRQCAGFLAVNKGDTIAFVNQVQLLPPAAAGLSGESFGIEANAGEIYSGSIVVQFESLAGNPQVILIQKFYK